MKLEGNSPYKAIGAIFWVSFICFYMVNSIPMCLTGHDHDITEHEVEECSYCHDVHNLNTSNNSECELCHCNLNCYSIGSRSNHKVTLKLPTKELQRVNLLCSSNTAKQIKNYIIPIYYFSPNLPQPIRVLIQSLII